MLELSRVQADVNPSAAWCADPPQGLALGLARTDEELEAIQRLRYEVLIGARQTQCKTLRRVRAPGG